MSHRMGTIARERGELVVERRRCWKTPVVKVVDVVGVAVVDG